MPYCLIQCSQALENNNKTNINSYTGTLYTGVDLGFLKGGRHFFRTVITDWEGVEQRTEGKELQKDQERGAGH